MGDLTLAWIITTVILPLVTGATGWFTGRRKSDAEARKVEAEAKRVEAEARKLEITNENAVIEQYKNALADVQAYSKHQVDEMREINRDLMATIDPLRKRIESLEKEVRALKQENAKLRSERN